MPAHAILIPGNGCGEDLSECMWYPWLAAKLIQHCCSIDLRGFPDHFRAREGIWVPFVVDELGLTSESIVIGHSSGAACALRLMEKYKFKACILVSAYNSDLGDTVEQQSGYFSRPFDYERMRSNVLHIVQFHSSDDHLVPVAVARDVAKSLMSQYHESSGNGHFQAEEYHEIWEAIAPFLS